MAKSYKEKLLDPRWQKKRLDILTRDNYKCCHCGDESETLHVHHREYIKGFEPWEYSDEYYITLCKVCHILADYPDFFPNETYYFKHKLGNPLDNIQKLLVTSSTGNGIIVRIIEVDCSAKKVTSLVSFPVEKLDTLLEKYNYHIENPVF